MPETVVPPAGSASPGATTSSLIAADLGISSSPTPTPTPSGAGADQGTQASVDPAVAGEIAAIPGDDDQPIVDAADEQTDTGQQTDAQAEAEGDEQKPAIPNLDESRWKRVHAGYKYAQELGKALGVVGEDGRVDLSLFPSIEDFKGMQGAYSDRIAMEHDFSSGDPNNAQAFVENWNTFSPQGMTAVAAQLPEFLARANQGAYNQMAGPVLNRFLDFMYQAPDIRDSALKQRLLDAARVTEWWLNGMPDQGGYRSDDEIVGGARRAQPDPREQNLAAREKAIREYERQTTTNAWNGFKQAVNSQIQQSVATDVEQALAPLKPLYPNQISYEAVRDRFQSQIQQALRQDQVAQRQWDVAVERARATRSEADRDALVRMYGQMVKRAVHAVRGKFITEASQGIKQNSDARHQQLQKSAAKVGPTAAAAPRPQSVMSKLEKKSGETGFEFQQRQILADLG